jgi:hypothetical protein
MAVVMTVFMVMVMVMVMVMMLPVTMVVARLCLRAGMAEMGGEAGVGALGGQEEKGVDPTPSHREHGRAWSEAGANLVDHGRQLGSLQAVGTTDQNKVSGFKLVLEEIFDRPEVIQAGIRPALGIHRIGITHHMTGREGLAIDHGDHSMNAGPGADGWPTEGRHKWFRKSQPTGFHHDAVEVVGPLQQTQHGWQELVLNRAAEAAVRQFHQATIQIFGVTKATGGQQIAIDADLTELIDQNGKLQTAFKQEMA